MYRFNVNDAERFSKARSIKNKVVQNRMIFESCPYCSEVCAKDKQFSISLREGVFCCTACGVRGDMIRLARDFDFSLGAETDYFINPSEAYKDHECRNTSNAITIPHIVQLSEVKPMDVFEIGKVPTGIEELDRLLYGGLPLGGVCLLSGKCGDGKSTLGSQMVANAVMHGFNVLAYSGELPNYLFKSWLDFQIAGSQHVVEYGNRWGGKQYRISECNRKMIEAWYHDRVFLYDSSVIGNDEANLFVVIERMVQERNVRMVLVDNLMTALELAADLSIDKYERQAQFVKKLAALAMKHGILVLLVAHKRKNNFSTNENDEVSGAADITNLASCHVVYDRDKEQPQDKRRLRLTKNRLFGRLELEGFELSFDPKSKRIFGAMDDPNKLYGWEQTDFIPMTEAEFASLPWEKE